MDINILEDSKTKLVMELPGRGHTICNALKHELWNDKHVKMASYTISHPLIGVPKMVVETSGEEPRKAISSALSSLSKQAQSVASEARKL